MKRVRSLSRKDFMSLNAHHNIGRLDADNQIVIAHILYQFYFIKRAFTDSVSCNSAVFFNEILLKRSGINAYSDGNVTLFGAVYNGLNLVARSYISGIYTDLVRSVLHSHNGHLVIKMNVRNKRYGNLLFDLRNRFGGSLIGNSTSDDLASRFFKCVYLVHGGFYIRSLGICHRLYRYRITVTDLYSADVYLFGIISV